jgi:hypothetical protein
MLVTAIKSNTTHYLEFDNNVNNKEIYYGIISRSNNCSDSSNDNFLSIMGLWYS